MKITHINTLPSGGAASAAIRIHKGLLKEGVDSRMIFLRNCPAEVDKVDTFLKTESVSFSVRVKSKLTGDRSIENKLKKEVINKGNHYETISFPLSSYAVEDHPWVQDTDIIHLHWISKFINYPSFFKKAKKPMVWTLHDMNPICGIFHYRNDLVTNEEDFGYIDRTYAQMKKDILSTVNYLSVVTPSSWLGNLSSKSEILGRFAHHVIPYGLDTELFKPYDQGVARQVFNLPQDKKIFLFVSKDLNNRRKGLDLLLEAFQFLKNKEQVAVCAVGKLDKDIGIKNIFCTGLIHDDRLMALLYSAADAFVLPSREDNLPNTMLEAIACGTPVISFAVGGMKEVIKSGFNGLTASELSAESLSLMLDQFLLQSQCFDCTEIRKFAMEEFSLHKQAIQYLNIYNKMLRN